jgi:predicted ATP-grasp superfamily ATP-dependent carboligase
VTAVDVPAVVLTLGEGRFDHGALGAIRSLGRLGVAVHLAGAAGSAPSRSRYLRSTTVIEPSDRAGVVARLGELGHRLPDRPVLVTIGDRAAMLVDDHRAALAPSFRFADAPPGLVTALADKGRLLELATAAGVEVPRTVRPVDLAGADAFAADVGFPVVVKAADPRAIRWAEGERSVAVADDRRELHGLLAGGDGTLRTNLLLQEFLPGSADAVWFFHGYFDGQSVCRFGAVGRKLREDPPGGGLTTLGVVAPNPAVEDAAIRLLQTAGYRGIVDAEFRHDRERDRYLAIDVNPRSGANFRLFVDDHGLDVVRALYLDLTGQPVEGGAVPAGRRWVVETLDPGTWPSYYGDRTGVPWRTLPASFRGARETAWFALDDLRPFAAAAGDRVGALVTRSARVVGRVSRRLGPEKRGSRPAPPTAPGRTPPPRPPTR